MKALIATLIAIPLQAQNAVDPSAVARERALRQHYAAEVRRQSKPLDNPAVAAYGQR